MKNARMDEFTDECHGVYPRLRVLGDEKDLKYGYKHIQGVVEHRLGVVAFSLYMHWPVKDQRGAKGEMKSLQLHLIHEGKEYSRWWDAWYGLKTVARLANEFITEIKGGDA